MLAVKHDNNFDLIRLLAAMQVALLHTFWWLQVPLPAAVDYLLKCFPGVPIFFVVSGFLITRSYIGRQRGLVAYLGSRALRIYPALWLQYLLVIVLMASTGGFALATVLQPMFWKWLLAAMFLGSNFWANLAVNDSPFTWDGLYQGYPSDVLWTIPVELGFYLLVPLVFSRTLARLGLTPWLIALCFVASLWFAMEVGPLLRTAPSANTTGMIHSSPAPYFWLFLAGATVANYWPKLQVFFVGRGGWWLLAFVLLTTFYFLKTGKTVVDYRVPDLLVALRVLLLAGLVLAVAHTWPWLSSWMRGRDLSYGLYLFHMPLPLGLYSAGITGEAWLAWASLLFALLLAAASWVWIESPCLAMRSRLGYWHLARLPSIDWQSLRPMLLWSAGVAVFTATVWLVMHSSLFDRRGQEALDHFFAGTDGILVQSYQTPGLVLHRGALEVSGSFASAGLELVVEAASQGARRLEVTGHQKGEQPVSGRLTIDGGAPSYFRMPDGELSVTVAPGSRVELLIYADLPYVYRIEQVALMACPQCETSEQMQSGVKRDRPDLCLVHDVTRQDVPNALLQDDLLLHGVEVTACGLPMPGGWEDPWRDLAAKDGIIGPDVRMGQFRKGVISISGAEPATRDELVSLLVTQSTEFAGRP